MRFTQVRFRNFKALSAFTVSLESLNVLVGPNNCGKSTVLSAFRALDAGLRRARARSAEPIRGPNGEGFGYSLSPDSLPISLENVHTEYSDEDSIVEFRLSGGSRLTLHFPPEGGARLFPETASGRTIRTPSQFRKAFPISVTPVPVLGPLEDREEILQETTVRRNLLTHRASAHFRNYWWHYPEGFTEFAALIRRTWPGMTISEPERVSAISNEIAMYCSENRIDRELYWAGFGFQVWSQLLTHITRAVDATLLVIDEPEIYLHPDVQRQLVGILRDSPADVVVATHSSEIMAEADPGEVLIVDKSRRRAERLRDVEGVQRALDAVGSIQNVTLAQLAQNRRVLFVESIRDYTVLRRFARKLGLSELAAGLGITAVASEGLTAWARVEGTAWGLERLVSSDIRIASVFDRDFLCDEEVADIEARLRERLSLARLHGRKELENYLLHADALQKALERAIQERSARTGILPPQAIDVRQRLVRLAAGQKSDLQAQYLAKRADFMRTRTSDDSATINRESLRRFDEKWATLNGRLECVRGKRLLRTLRAEIQEQCSVNLTDARIIEAMRPGDIPPDLIELLQELDRFRGAATTG